MEREQLLGLRVVAALDGDVAEVGVRVRVVGLQGERATEGRIRVVVEPLRARRVADEVVCLRHVGEASRGLLETARAAS